MAALRKPSKSKPAKTSSKKLSGEKEALRTGLETLAGRPLGPTLTALLELELRNDCFHGLVAPDTWKPELRARRLEAHGIFIIGEAAHGFFGPHRSRLGKTIDEGLVVYSDKQGLPPEVVGRTIAEFLSIWAFIPDFFTLYSNTAQELEELHRELLTGEGADLELKKDVRAVLKLPGVKKLTSGKQVRVLLNQLVEVATELWPNQKREPLPPETTRAQLNAAGQVRSATVNDATLEDVRQDLEQMRKKLRESAEEALQKLRERSGASAFFEDKEDA